MNRNKLFLGCCMLTAGLLSACSNDNEGAGNDGSKEIVLRSSVANLQTRADGDHPYTQIISGQDVGVYVHATGGTFGSRYDNKCFTSQGGGSLNCTETLYYPESGSVDIVAYHPKQASVPTTTSFDFTVNDDQSDNTNYYNSDLLHAVTTNVTSQSSAVSLGFSHLLSNVVYTLNTSGTSVAVTIEGVEKAAKFNLESGTVDAADTSVKGNVVLHNTYGAVVAPQTVAANSVNFSVTVDGTTYTSNNVSAIEYKSGKIYKYNLKITAGGLTVDECEISDWDATASEITGGLVAVTPTVTYCPSFTEVGNTVTLSGENLSSVSSVTVGGEAATITSKSDTSITIEMPSSIAATTAAAITFDGTEVVADTEFSVVNSVLWDGNMENASLSTFASGGIAALNNESNKQWFAMLNIDNTTNLSGSIANETEQGNYIEFSTDVTKNTSWFNHFVAQRIELADLSLDKYALSFKAKTAGSGRVRASLILRTATGNVSHFAVLAGNETTSAVPYLQVDPGTSWAEYNATFDLNYYGSNGYSAAVGTQLSDFSAYDYAVVLFWIVNAGTYSIDDVRLEKQ